MESQPLLSDCYKYHRAIGAQRNGDDSPLDIFDK